LIRFFRCGNPECKKEFSLVDGSKDSFTLEACPFCLSSQLILLKREGYISSKRKTKAPEQQEDPWELVS